MTLSNCFNLGLATC